ncbi:MAG: hypothetical protein F6K64_31225, partial [Moorea sp. SIO3A2]|nr:hypothetical protein [Moorena sp. SIO3A2]
MGEAPLSAIAFGAAEAFGHAARTPIGIVIDHWESKTRSLKQFYSVSYFYKIHLGFYSQLPTPYSLLPTPYSLLP